MKTYYVYILTNHKNGTLYVGMTNNAERRISEHRLGEIEGFTREHNLKRVVYVLDFDDVNEAIAFEKKLKRWRRQWKINLIEEENPDWEDLFERWFPDSNQILVSSRMRCGAKYRFAGPGSTTEYRPRTSSAALRAAKHPG